MTATETTACDQIRELEPNQEITLPGRHSARAHAIAQGSDYAFEYRTRIIEWDGKTYTRITRTK